MIFSVLHPGERAISAVHGEHNAGHKAGRALIDEEQHRADKLFQLAVAAHRRAAHDMRAARGRRAVRVELERVALPGHAEARRNRIPAHAPTRQIRRQPLGQAGDGGLRAGFRFVSADAAAKRAACADL